MLWDSLNAPGCLLRHSIPLQLARWQAPTPPQLSVTQLTVDFMLPRPMGSNKQRLHAGNGRA